MYEPLRDLACADPAAVFVHDATLLGEKGGHLFTDKTEEDYHHAGGVVYPSFPCASRNTMSWRPTTVRSPATVRTATAQTCLSYRSTDLPCSDSAYVDAQRMTQPLRELLYTARRLSRTVCGTAASLLPALRVLWPTAVPPPPSRPSTCGPSTSASSSSTSFSSPVDGGTYSAPPLRTHRGVERVRALAFHPHRMLLAVVVQEDDEMSHRARVHVYDVAESCLACVLTHAFQREVHGVAWKPYARAVLAVGCRGGVLLWCVEAGGVRPAAASGRAPARWLRLRPGEAGGGGAHRNDADAVEGMRVPRNHDAWGTAATSRVHRCDRPDTAGWWRRWLPWPRTTAASVDAWDARYSAPSLFPPTARGMPHDMCAKPCKADSPSLARHALLEVSAQAHTDETAWALFYPCLPHRQLPVTALAFSHRDGRYVVCGSRYTTQVTLLDMAVAPHDPAAHRCGSLTPSLDAATEQLLVADDDSFVVVTAVAHPSLTLLRMQHHSPAHPCHGAWGGHGGDAAQSGVGEAAPSWRVMGKPVRVAVSAPVLHMVRAYGLAAHHYFIRMAGVEGVAVVRVNPCVGVEVVCLISTALHRGVGGAVCAMACSARRLWLRLETGHVLICRYAAPPRRAFTLIPIGVAVVDEGSEMVSFDGFTHGSLVAMVERDEVVRFVPSYHY